MKCLVCGLPEGQGQCGECLALAREMQANDEVFGMLREECLPPLVVRLPHRRPVYALVSAAAAILAIAAVPILRHPAKSPKPVVAKLQRAAGEALTIRIMTPDPDVVILWQIDPEGGGSQ